MKNEILTPENVQSQGYKIHYRLKHTELLSFVKEYLKKRNSIIIFYWLFNIVLLAVMIYLFIFTADFEVAFTKFFLGVAAFLILVPFHEFIHGLGYKFAGASHVSYKAIWKKLIFYAMADRFVAKKKSFILLAVAPFLILNTLLISLALFLPPPYHWIALGALFIHTSGCAGDFALMSYFYTFWDQDPVTYDLVKEEETYFLLKM